MANAGTINLELKVTDKGSATIGNVERTVVKSTGKMAASFKSLGTGIKSIGSKLLNLKTLAIVSLAGWGLKRLVDAWEGLSATQEKAEAGMTQAMKSMGRYTKSFHDQVLNTASALQKMSTFGDENIIMGTKFLMTYKDIGDDVMPRAMQAMTDLAALMGGDFQSSANMLGKASMGMTGELRRVGITVDENTFKTRGFIGVLGEIENQVKGQAKALRDTKAGGLEAFAGVVKDVWEKFGLFTSSVKSNIATKALPWVEKLNAKLAEWIGSGKMEQSAKKWAGYIISAAQAVWDKAGPILKDLSNLGERFKKAGGWAGVFSGKHLAGTGLGIDQTEAGGQKVTQKIQKTSITSGGKTYTMEDVKDTTEDVFNSLTKANNELAKFGDQWYSMNEKGDWNPVIEPQIKKSPVVPWSQGIASMQDDIDSLGGTIKQTFDMSSLNSMIGNISDVAAKMTRLEYFRGGRGGDMEYNVLKENMELMQRLVKFQIAEATNPNTGAAAGGRAVNVNIYASEGQDTDELARKVKRAIAEQDARGIG